MSQREFDIVLVGATGFTGLLVAKCLAANAPTNCRWALAGRSTSKLEDCRRSLEAVLPSKQQLELIQVDSLKKDQCETLARRAKCIITTVGPYSILGEQLLRACAVSGTHYCDLTGEIPFVKKMIYKYEKEAQRSGSKIVCCSGFDSIPVDVSNSLVAKYIKENYNSGTKDAKTVIELMKGGASGGTLSSVLNLLDIFSLREIGAAHAPWSIATRKGSPSQKNIPHVIWDADTQLYCGSWVGDNVDRSVASRSWSILNYGDSWTTYGYLGFSNIATAYAYLGCLYFGMLMIGISPIRWLLKRVVTQPGSGPSQQQMDDGRMSMRAFGTSDTDPSKRAVARFEVDADPGYKGTAAMLTAVGLTLAFDQKTQEGGFITPAVLGDALIDRLRDAGMRISVDAI